MASTSVTRSFNVGLISADPQGGYSGSTTASTDVTISVPDWQVTPLSTGRSVQYLWDTNTPTSYATISGGGGGPFSLDPSSTNALNDLNRSSFTPTSLTVWTGAGTWGKVNLSVEHDVTLADHYTSYVYPGKTQDQYALGTVHFGWNESPDTVTPVTTNPVSSGINLCDPAVKDPDFTTQCSASS